MGVPTRSSAVTPVAAVAGTVAFVEALASDAFAFAATPAFVAVLLGFGVAPPPVVFEFVFAPRVVGFVSAPRDSAGIGVRSSAGVGMLTLPR